MRPATPARQPCRCAISALGLGASAGEPGSLMVPVSRRPYLRLNDSDFFDETGDAVNERTIAAVILAAGIALAGLLAGNGLARAKSADRYVTVKGVTEREVRADLAIWPLHVVAADNDLNTAHKRLEASVAG